MSFKKISFNLILVAILGILVGFVLKKQALDKITTGFDDRYVVGGKQAYDLNKIETQIRTKQKNQLKEQEKQKEKIQKEMKNQAKNQAESGNKK